MPVTPVQLVSAAASASTGSSTGAQAIAADAAVGETVWVAVIVGGATAKTSPSCVDSKSNVWTLVANFLSVTTGTSASVLVYRSKLTTALSHSGDTITVSWTNAGSWAIVAKSIGQGWTFNSTAGVVNGSGTSATDATASITPNAGDFVMMVDATSVAHTALTLITSGFVQDTLLPSTGTNPRQLIIIYDNAAAAGAVTPSLHGNGGSVVFNAVAFAFSLSAYTATESDSVALSESLSWKASYARTETESAAIADSQVSKSGHVRTETDAVVLSESLGWKSAHTRTITDAVGLAEALVMVNHFTRTVTDSATWPGGVYPGTDVYPGASGDTFRSGDGVAFAVGHLSTPTDGVGLSDSVHSATGFPRTQSDTVALSDSVVKKSGNARTEADSLGVADSVGVKRHSGRSITDIIAMTDGGVGWLLGATRPISDSVGCADAVVGGFGHVRVCTDGVGLADSVRKVEHLSFSLSDSIGVADAVTRTTHWMKTNADSVGVAAVPHQTVHYGKSLADAVVLAESVRIILGHARPLSDALALADLVTFTARILNESETNWFAGPLTVCVQWLVTELHSATRWESSELDGV